MEVIDNAFQNSLHDALALIALLLIALGMSRLLKYREVNNWVKTDAVICFIKENIEKVSFKYATTKHYYPYIEYVYQYKGNEYKSNKVAFNKENMWVCEVDDYGIPLKDSDKFWNNWIEGSEITVFINPSHPDQSIIINNLNKERKSHNLALVVSGIIIGVIWFALK